MLLRPTIPYEKVYPTAVDSEDFYGRVFARTLTRELTLTEATYRVEASQKAGFTVLVPAYIPTGLQPASRLMLRGRIRTG